MYIKFHENISSGSRVVPCRKTGGQTNLKKLIVAFRNFANALKKTPSYNGINIFITMVTKLIHYFLLLCITSLETLDQQQCGFIQLWFWESQKTRKMRAFLMSRVHFFTSHIIRFFILEPPEGYPWWTEITSTKPQACSSDRMYTRYQHMQKTWRASFFHLLRIL